MNMENAVLIVERPHKKVYKCEKNIVKVFHPEHPKADVFNEALNTARVEAAGLDIPKVKEVTEIDGKWSLVIEYKDGKTLEEMMAVVDNALANGYSIEWATDVSEKGFDRIKAIGIIPETDIDGMEGTEAEKWGKLSAAEKEAALYKFDKPVKEKKITQEMRQIAFDNYETTDDHGMVIVGTAVDQQGNPFFKVKNSWDVRPPYDGYYYFSHPFVEYKTLSVMVNKNAIPQEIRTKLGI